MSFSFHVWIDADRGFTCYLNNRLSRWEVRDLVEFGPFSTSEQLQTFENLIFMLFLH